MKTVLYTYDPLMQTPAQGVRVLWLRRTNSHGLLKSCGEKGTVRPLSQGESALATLLRGQHLDPCLDRLLLAFYIKEGSHSLGSGLL